MKRGKYVELVYAEFAVFFLHILLRIRAALFVCGATVCGYGEMRAGLVEAKSFGGLFVSWIDMVFIKISFIMYGL